MDSVVKELLDDPAIEACKGAVSTVYEFWRPSASYFGLWRSKEDRDAENEMLDSEWGPERDLFTMKRPARYAVFNSISDNNILGDERNFVCVRRKVEKKFVSRLQVVPGYLYEVYRCA